MSAENSEEMEDSQTASVNFLLQVLQATTASKSNPLVVYPLLSENLDRLDADFAKVLRGWVVHELSTLEISKARSIAETICDFSNLIQEFSLGSRASNLEIAIAGYEAILAFLTHAQFLEDWARTQINLGNAYIDRIQGDRAENLEQAIHCFQQALQVYTSTEFPKQWAETQHNLGITYYKRIKGDRAENLEQAINFCRQALMVRTRTAMPVEWAQTLNCLATAYYYRIRDDRKKNWEETIQCCYWVLEVCSREDYPMEWAEAQLNLGRVYCTITWGNEADRREEAIRCCQRAQEIYTRERFPDEWAKAQHNLGIAYQDRIRGDRAENLERSIQCLEQALQVWIREGDSFQRALGQYNLGRAYCRRIRGDRAENLERAIYYLEQALQVWSRDRDSTTSALAQNDLGIAWRERIRGDRAENLERSIQCFEQALQVWSRDRDSTMWAIVQHGLGTTYQQRIRGDWAENLERSTQCFEQALQVRTRDHVPEKWAMTLNNLGNTYGFRLRGDRAENLERSIQCFKQVLHVRTRETDPDGYATTIYNLGRSYSQRIQGNRTENLENAIACIRSALQVDTPQSSPLACLRAARVLGELGFTQGKWDIAIEGYSAAIDAVEKSRTWATSESRRQEILAESIGVYENMVQACVNAGQLDKAMECVERSRSKRLVDLMASHDLYSGGDIPQAIQEFLQQYEALQQKIDQLRPHKNADSNRELLEMGTHSRAALKAYSETIAELEAEKQQVWENLRRLDPVLAGEIQVSAPEIAAMQRLIDQPTTAILSFYTTSNDTYIFVLRQDQVTCHTCTGQGRETLQLWIRDNWLLPYLPSEKETREEKAKREAMWRSRISLILAELAQRLRLDDLIAQQLDGIAELVLVPHLYLHQIPFAALPIQDFQHRYLGEKYLIRYIPICQVLEFCSQRGEVGDSLSYGTVEDATEDLPCASFEGFQIARLYNIPDSQRLKGRSKATVRNYQELAQKVQVLHSSHHALSRLDNPLESLLQLGDGTITLGQLMTPAWRLPHLSDVFLSCCETNLGLPSSTDDILTLAAGFLCAGARSVVSTLWSVDDLATALFCLFYYQQRSQGRDRPTALQQAQVTMRNLTGEKLKSTYFPELQLFLDEQFDRATAVNDDTTASKIYNTSKRLRQLCKQARPFESPFYWAAFTCQGLR